MCTPLFKAKKVLLRRALFPEAVSIYTQRNKQ